MNLSRSSGTPHYSVLPLQFSAVDLEQSLFQPFPSEVVFQNYVPCEVYEVPLILRNNDTVSARTWRFNAMLEEENRVTQVVLQHSKLPAAAQHEQNKISHHLGFTRW